MLEFLVSASFNCTQAEAVMLRIKKNKDLPASVKVELVKEIKAYKPGCKWDRQFMSDFT